MSSSPSSGRPARASRRCSPASPASTSRTAASCTFRRARLAAAGSGAGRGARELDRHALPERQPARPSRRRRPTSCSRRSSRAARTPMPRGRSSRAWPRSPGACATGAALRRRARARRPGRGPGQRPALLLADEPTGELDSATPEEIVSLLLKRAAAGCAIVAATHNQRLAGRRAPHRATRRRAGGRMSDAPIVRCAGRRGGVRQRRARDRGAASAPTARSAIASGWPSSGPRGRARARSSTCSPASQDPTAGASSGRRSSVVCRCGPAPSASSSRARACCRRSRCAENVALPLQLRAGREAAAAASRARAARARRRRRLARASRRTLGGQAQRVAIARALVDAAAAHPRG